jgi:hypothetical protein
MLPLDYIETRKPIHFWLRLLVRHDLYIRTLHARSKNQLFKTFHRSLHTTTHAYQASTYRSHSFHQFFIFSGYFLISVIDQLLFLRAIGEML